MARHPLDRNIGLFAAYRVLFNLRFYYPVFALFYLDAGMSLEAFAWLQGLWSLSIIVFEVPSGMLADTIGRRKTLRLAAFLAVLEMIVFAVAHDLMGFAVNRILSGFNESLASGADSALLYDSLKARGREGEYKKWLGATQFYGLTLGSVSTILGAYLYTFNIRYPIWVTVGCMTCAAGVSLFFREPTTSEHALSWRAQWALLRDSVRVLAQSPILGYLVALMVVVDCSARIVLVHTSIYYQALLIPTAWFGLVGVGVRLVTSVVSKNAYRVDAALGFHRAVVLMLFVMAVGFGGMAAMVPYYGIAFVPILVSGMYFLALTVEGEINKRIPSDRRATVLSLKNMALNLAFALGMPLFAAAAGRGLQVGFGALFLFFVAAASILALVSWKLWPRDATKA
ncbi:Predicted arabinose efflux permease, MFS family [Desulfacinum hydrothermale DSM 13146]|uniref:Predicted arabinose efflux permease, MFS family n=1 Tax=Desulfacinum hydrothermale DSM 13146 TaxID=1121390 RepID=A0A1W1XVB5_9BACT|nr:MFS transporter [Desulfacinum hydrothermale]SMC27468.1 Predicted arabinose efflux permease, MFS family [Desulfacinum hydrothermale DSM 13146]